MTKKNKITMVIICAILLVVMIAFWGSIASGIALLSLVTVPTILIRQWYKRTGDPMDYSESPKDEIPDNE